MRQLECKNQLLTIDSPPKCQPTQTNLNLALENWGEPQEPEANLAGAEVQLSRMWQEQIEAPIPSKANF